MIPLFFLATIPDAATDRVTTRYRCLCRTQPGVACHGCLRVGRKHATKRGTVTVPGKPSGDVAPGTWHGIMRQAGHKGGH